MWGPELLLRPLFLLAVVTAAFVWIDGIRLVRGVRSLARLREIDPFGPDEGPPVSVIIPARNEERKIEGALRSVLGQVYEPLEVIVIDDRSDDGTGAILDRLAEESPRLRVRHVTELPEGWLGKNHAVHQGARMATGRYLLFTDADVVLEPTTLARAMRYAAEHDLDHIAVFPRLFTQNVLLDLLVGTFGFFFSLFTKPWKARDPSSERFIGIGAFNLVRSEAYRAVDGHRRIAMRPDDDLRLGQLLKRGGARQEAMIGVDLVSVEWYSSAAEMVRGLMKNAFAVTNYRVREVVAATVAQLLVNVWPVLAVFVTGGATRGLNALIVVSLLALYVDHARRIGARARFAPALPLAALFFSYIVWRSALIALITGHVTWRSTRYPLEQLKANRI